MCLLTRFLINQCQIITFFILKSDIIENSRIELRVIVLPVPSNQIKVNVCYHFTLQLGTFVIFFLFHIEIEGKGGWIIGGGGGAKGMLAPLSTYWAPLFLRLCTPLFSKDNFATTVFAPRTVCYSDRLL